MDFSFISRKNQKDNIITEKSDDDLESKVVKNEDRDDHPINNINLNHSTSLELLDNNVEKLETIIEEEHDHDNDEEEEEEEDDWNIEQEEKYSVIHNDEKEEYNIEQDEGEYDIEEEEEYNCEEEQEVDKTIKEEVKKEYKKDNEIKKDDNENNLLPNQNLNQKTEDDIANNIYNSYVEDNVSEEINIDNDIHYQEEENEKGSNAIIMTFDTENGIDGYQITEIKEEEEYQNDKDAEISNGIKTNIENETPLYPFLNKESNDSLFPSIPNQYKDTNPNPSPSNNIYSPSIKSADDNKKKEKTNHFRKSKVIMNHPSIFQDDDEEEEDLGYDEEEFNNATLGPINQINNIGIQQNRQSLKPSINAEQFNQSLQQSNPNRQFSPSLQQNNLTRQFTQPPQQNIPNGQFTQPLQPNQHTRQFTQPLPSNNTTQQFTSLLHQNTTAPHLNEQKKENTLFNDTSFHKPTYQYTNQSNILNQNINHGIREQDNILNINGNNIGNTDRLLGQNIGMSIPKNLNLNTNNNEFNFNTSLLANNLNHDPIMQNNPNPFLQSYQEVNIGDIEKMDSAGLVDFIKNQYGNYSNRSAQLFYKCAIFIECIDNVLDNIIKDNEKNESSINRLRDTCILTRTGNTNDDAIRRLLSIGEIMLKYRSLYPPIRNKLNTYKDHFIPSVKNIVSDNIQLQKKAENNVDMAEYKSEIDFICNILKTMDEMVTNIATQLKNETIVLDKKYENMYPDLLFDIITSKDDPNVKKANIMNSLGQMKSMYTSNGRI